LGVRDITIAYSIFEVKTVKLDSSYDNHH